MADLVTLILYRIGMMSYHGYFDMTSKPWIKASFLPRIFLQTLYLSLIRIPLRYLPWLYLYIHSSRTKLTENGPKWWFPTIIWKKYSHNPIQTCGVHLLGECSEIIRFWAMLPKFWPSVGHKMTENGGFRPLSGKVFTQSTSNLVCTLIVWVFRINLLFGNVGQISALLWP